MSEKEIDTRSRDEPTAGGTRPLQSPDTDRVSEADVERLADLVGDLEETTAALLEYGSEHDVPAVEHTARRIRETARVLDHHVPRTALEDDER